MHASTTVLFVCLSCFVGALPDVCTVSSHFSIVSWNVDSGDADPHMVALRVAQMQGVDLWGFSEVRSEQWAKLLQDAAGQNRPGAMAGILSPTGGSDRSLICYDTSRFEMTRQFELGWEDASWHLPGMGLRPALIARFRHLATGQEFLFMVNRFYPQWAAMQAVRINEWAARQALPVIAVGSYYFQYGLGPQPVVCDGQMGLKTMAFDGAFQWIKPENPVKTFDHELNTIEDFVFLANAAGRLHAQSAIIVEPGDFPDDASTSDHRPLRTTVTIAGEAPDAALRREIRRRIERLRCEIEQLEALVRQLPD